MHFTAADKNISVAQRDQFYIKLACANTNGIDSNKVAGFGTLANEHSLFQKSILGFLPGWCSKTALVKNKDILEWYERHFNLRKKLTRSTLKGFLKTLQKKLELSIGISFTTRDLENILCKCYRILNATSSDREWCDTLMEHSMLYRPEEDGTTVIYPDGEEIFIETDSVIATFGYDNHRMTMKQIVEELNLPNTLPKYSKITNFQFYDYVWKPTARFELEFPMNNIPVSDQKRDYCESIFNEAFCSFLLRGKRKRTRC